MPAEALADAVPVRCRDWIVDVWAALHPVAAVGLLAAGIDDPDHLPWLFPLALFVTWLGQGLWARRPWSRRATLILAWAVVLAPRVLFHFWLAREVFENFTRAARAPRPRGGSPEAAGLIAAGMALLAMLAAIAYVVAAPVMGLLIWRLRRPHVRAQFVPSAQPFRFRRRHAWVAAGVVLLGIGCGALAALHETGAGPADVLALGGRAFDRAAVRERRERRDHDAAEAGAARLVAAIERGDKAEADRLRESLGHERYWRTSGDVWLRGTRHADPRVRAAFVELLGPNLDPLRDEAGRRVSRRNEVVPIKPLGPAPAVETFLRTALADPDARVRRAAIPALRAYGVSKETGSELTLKAMQDDDPGVRQAVLDRLLGSTRRPHSPVDPAFEPALRTLAHDPAESVRGRAALLLAEFGAVDPWLVKPLRTMLRTDDESHRDRAASALAALGPAAADALPDLLPLLASNTQARRAVIRALAAIGPAAADAVPALDRLLDDPEMWTRAEAAQALGAIGRPSRGSEDRLFAMLKTDDFAYARAYAALALAQAAPASSRNLAALSEALDDEAYVRRDAAEGLAWYGADAAPAAPALRSHLSDADLWVRLNVALALMKIDPEDAQARAMYVAALAEETEIVVTHWNRGASSSFYALYTFRKLGRDAAPAEPRLRELLDHEKPSIREYAAEALRLIGASGDGSPGGAE